MRSGWSCFQGVAYCVAVSLPSIIGRPGFVFAQPQECANLYGVHDHSPAPWEYLNRVSSGGACGWITATVEIGHNPADMGGLDFSAFANAGHTVICRLNNAYCSGGTIPLPEHYAGFAQRCANFVQSSSGCHIWLIGNETNLAVEWPPRNGHKEYVSPQDYADCFRLCYDAIKAVRPNDKVICQALAPWAGPYGPGSACGFTHDAQPVTWTDYMYQMLVAIEATGGIDGIALHVNSRGYGYDDIHSTQKVLGQYFSFYVYKDWVDLGTPPSLYHLPLYVTECNGMFYWKGGHPEDPSQHYEAGWMQEVFAEIDRYNQTAASAGKPIYRCLNMYRWCSWCDGWNIDGADNPYKAQIVADLDEAVAAGYTWPEVAAPTAAFAAEPQSGYAPLPVSFTDESYGGTAIGWSWTFGDGGSSEQQNPVYTYDAPGTYSVSLTTTFGDSVATHVEPDLVTVYEPVQPGENLVANGDFAAGTADWTEWIERDAAGDFSATADEVLQVRGSNYNGGVYQQFSTGGAGNTIVVSGWWESDPTVADSQWAEVIVINSDRLPVNGVDETPASQEDDVLLFKNDTWASPGGWSGAMADAASAGNGGAFEAAGDRATILLKSGNIGSGLTGVRIDNLVVRILFGDFDDDGSVDLADFVQFVDCHGGPDASPSPSPPIDEERCMDVFDANGDEDIDMHDFRPFQESFSD